MTVRCCPSFVEVDSHGDLSADDVYPYTYNNDGIRVTAYHKAESWDSGWSTDTTDYLIDANNPTGYAQVIEEWNPDTTNLDVSYVIGHDHIAQWDDSTGDVLYLLADGHGSTRLLTDADGAVEDRGVGDDQVFVYDAYGNLIDSPTTALTTLLYTGEQFNSTAGQYYLRARYYDPATGRFNRLDPFAGNNQDPRLPAQVPLLRGGSDQSSRSNGRVVVWTSRHGLKSGHMGIPDSNRVPNCASTPIGRRSRSILTGRARYGNTAREVNGRSDRDETLLAKRAKDDETLGWVDHRAVGHISDPCLFYSSE